MPLQNVIEPHPKCNYAKKKNQQLESYKNEGENVLEKFDFIYFFNFAKVLLLHGAKLYIWLGTAKVNKGNNDFLA